jgi:hypothetical protein
VLVSNLFAITHSVIDDVRRERLGELHLPSATKILE